MADLVTPIAFLERLGLADILLWLLTFAVTYGILSQVDIPKGSKEAQAIIAAVLGFLVLLSAPTAMIALLTQMSGTVILIGVALLILVIFMEVAGLSSETDIIKDGKVVGKEKVSYMSNHPYIFVTIIFIIIALVFVSSGGMNLLGIRMPSTNFNMTGAIFLIAIVAAVAWMIMGKK